MDLEDAVAILKTEVRGKCSAYADRALAEVLSLVEEKFTSTSKQMVSASQIKPECEACLHVNKCKYMHGSDDCIRWFFRV